jgi:hypothetical protein
VGISVFDRLSEISVKLVNGIGLYNLFCAEAVLVHIPIVSNVTGIIKIGFKRTGKIFFINKNTVPTNIGQPI